MKGIKLLVGAAMAALVLGLVPASADHCQDVFIFQGVDAGNDVRRGFNTGFVGCTVDEHDEMLNTNVTVPGAQIAIVGVAGGLTPVSGTLTIGNDAPVPLTFTKNGVQNRWDSQSVPITNGGALVASVDVGGGEVITVTYSPVA